MHVEYLTARAFAEARRGLAGTIVRRLNPLASIPQRIFSRGPIPLLAPCLKVSLGSVCQKYFPRGFEIGTGLVERGSGAVFVFAWMRAWIKAAAPVCTGNPIRVDDDGIA
jgi:hypothetical protein